MLRHKNLYYRIITKDLVVLVVLCTQSEMSIPVSEKLQDVECYKMSDLVTDVLNGDSTAMMPFCAEKAETELSKDVENKLPSGTDADDCESQVETTEVSIDDKLDSGFSWVIVCASFVNCFIVGTMFIGFSILYVEITEYFGSSKGVAGWIGSVFMASGNAFGEQFSCCYFFSTLSQIILSVITYLHLSDERMDGWTDKVSFSVHQSVRFRG